MSIRSNNSGLKIGLAILSIYLILLAFLYTFAWSGRLHFDDPPNLGGLGQIEDRLDGLDFISRGIAGPLGRPLALATFALQHESWPDPRPFLIVNTLVHLFNAALVFFLALALARFASEDQRRNIWFALAVAAIWSASPFLASSSLMIVQRMTTLAGLFVFLGLLGYVHGRWMMRDNLRAGTYVAVGSISFCTLLGAFTKESAALLPVLALAAELTIIRGSQFAVPKLNPAVALTFLGAPTLAILGYLGYRGITRTGYQSRDFELGERLLSQARALWDYIFNLLAPNAAASSPYTDAFLSSRGILDPAVTLPALVGLVALVIVAWAARKAWPFFAFGVTFFLAGHLLESTTVPLELYFPHRNYVPAFGLYFAVLYAAIVYPRSKSAQRLAAAGVIGYAVIALLVLANSTALWGKPELAGPIWFVENPNSMRARQDLAGLYLQQGNAGGALALINDGLELHPRHPVLSLQRLIFCVEDQQIAEHFVTEARAALKADNPLPFGAAEQLRALSEITDGQECTPVTPELFAELLTLAFNNLQQFPNTGVQVTLLNAKAQFHANQGDYEFVRLALNEILDVQHRVEVVRLIADTYLQEGRGDLAREALTQAKAETQGNWLHREIDRARLERWISTLETTTQADPDW